MLIVEGKAGTSANPAPQVFAGVWGAAVALKYAANCAGGVLGNAPSTRAASPATCGEAWLVPPNPKFDGGAYGPYVTVLPRSAPTMSGLVRPSVVGPRLLKNSIVLMSYQGAAPTARSPGFELSAGLAMLRASVRN